MKTNTKIFLIFGLILAGFLPTVTLAVAPDYVVTTMMISPTSPVANSIFTAQVTVQNQGTAAGKGKQVTIWAHAPTLQDCDVAGDQTLPVGILAAGASTTVTVTGLAAGMAGTKTLRAFVNSACSMAETDGNNNQLIQTYTVTPPPQPDLVVTGITLSPVAPFTNSSFNAAITVINQGATPTNGGTLTAWTNQAFTQNCGVSGEKSITMGTLAAGESTVLTLTGFTTGTSSGNKTLRVFVDSACAITESNDSNNQFTQSYSVGTQLADFVITNISLTPDSPSTNTQFNAIITVKNQGVASGNGGQLTVWAHQSLAQNCGVNGDTSVAVGTLAAGDIKVVTLNGLTAGEIAGDKTLRAFVESSCATSESNETNNQFTKSYPVAGRADLVITQIILNPATPTPNTTFSATVTVKNQGTASSHDEQLTLWLNQGSEQTCGASGDQALLMGTIAAGANTTLTFSDLAADLAGTKQLRAFVDSPCTTSESNEDNNQLTKAYTVADASVITTGKLNDTGIISCSNVNQNDLSCPVSNFPGQDAEHGRDNNPATNSDNDGHAGFSFTKIDANGNSLAVSARDWNCVQDNVTGLMWEVKTNDGGLRDKDNTYTWYNSNSKTNGGRVGNKNGGKCSGGIDCDTASFVKKVNSVGLCGHNDWRLPSREELRSIASLDRINPAIDEQFFPNTNSVNFWSGSPIAGDSDYAWIVGFDGGNDYWGSRGSEFAVRLLRERQ